MFTFKTLGSDVEQQFFCYRVLMIFIQLIPSRLRPSVTLPIQASLDHCSMMIKT